VSSSTPGPAIGEPLNATKIVEPSLEARTPRGRLPTGIVCTTFREATSITLTVPLISFETNTRGPVRAGMGPPTVGCDEQAAVVTATIISAAITPRRGWPHPSTSLGVP
jgi:hypothetical protein